ncbi:TonB-dependent receptor [Adhaeribacter arboris]|uniref:TonB-dependent receptor n=1 Tax=Adhaeribacter arboris TaxID=2072846 RepID=A0A2T2YI32_9BACT|nr:TonB-dependent receptor [Adhaeribacter arboris]PSR55173.1 TonB-dependent receptor [Adhaeribacter arboris]
MIRCSWLLFLLICLLGYSNGVLGQQQADTLFTGSFTKTPFAEFVQQVEAKTSYHFFFSPATVDSLFVTLQVQEQYLPELLPQIFRNTPVQFAIDNQYRVFITKDTAIQTTLRSDFFEPATDSTISTVSPILAITASNPRSIRSRNTLETKLFEIGSGRATSVNSKANLAGYVRNLKTGEPITGASVYIQPPLIGVKSDQFGYYSLTLPVGRHELLIKSVGQKSTRRQIQITADGKLNIDLEEEVTTLKEVVVEAQKDKNVTGLQMGREQLDIKTIRQIPTAFGETDILRVVLTLPGVKSVGEGSTGFNVRGGATDQNLILFNGATIYNPAHLFGFFSAFNPDILKSVELYKSAIPAAYGGRLSSVLEIATRDGNKKQFSGSGGIGLLTSRLTLEGPIIKDKSAFLISGRSTYSDWLLQQLPNKTLRESAAAFYDVNVHLSHEANENNTFYVTAYTSRDKFKLGADTLYQYTNQSISTKWKHIFTNQLYGVVTGSLSRYSYNIESQRNPVNSSRLTYGVNQANLQVDLNYFRNETHTFNYGLSSIFYTVTPGKLQPLGFESLITLDALQEEKAIESAVYASDQITISPRLSVYLGLRYSLYQALGPRQVNQYVPGVPRTEKTITDTIFYQAGQSIAHYQGPEYRISAKYSLTDYSSLKVSYNRMRQYIHMLSNTASMSPADVWKLSDAYIRPQIGDQLAIGYYHNLKSNSIETSVEAYFKNMHDFVDYKSGATIILNHHLETDVVNAEGKAYGIELMVKKLTGKLNGWFSYTYARSLVRVNVGTPADQINNGKYYPSNFDKPHDFTLISNYRFNQRVSTSLNFTYNTGRPITLPLAKYYLRDTPRIFYSNRNEYRVPDYYRADFAVNLEGNHKIKKLAHSSWTFAVYNLTGRKNPFSIYFKSESNQIKGYQLAIFGQPIPTVTYNFRF